MDGCQSECVRDEGAVLIPTMLGSLAPISRVLLLMSQTITVPLRWTQALTTTARNRLLSTVMNQQAKILNMTKQPAVQIVLQSIPDAGVE